MIQVVAPVSRAAESLDGRPSVVERMMDVGLFNHYVSNFMDILAILYL